MGNRHFRLASPACTARGLTPTCAMIFDVPLDQEVTAEQNRAEKGKGEMQESQRSWARRKPILPYRLDASHIATRAIGPLCPKVEAATTDSTAPIVSSVDFHQSVDDLGLEATHCDVETASPRWRTLTMPRTVRSAITPQGPQPPTACRGKSSNRGKKD